MGKPVRNLTGQTFGRWTAIEKAEKPKVSTQNGVYWLFRCDCGAERVKRGAEVVNKGGSCGCLKTESNSKAMKKMQLEKYGTVEERFFNRFKKDPSGCWLWISHCDKDGYGILPATGAAVRAHRLSYEIHNGQIPDGMVVCHTCDNPSCVNPEHLFSGTTKDNCQDMLSKGRDKMVGSRNNKAKLTEDQVADIRKSDKSKYELADIYSVSVSTIKRIKNNTLWRHVK